MKLLFCSNQPVNFKRIYKDIERNEMFTSAWHPQEPRLHRTTQYTQHKALRISVLSSIQHRLVGGSVLFPHASMPQLAKHLVFYLSVLPANWTWKNIELKSKSTFFQVSMCNSKNYHAVLLAARTSKICSLQFSVKGTPLPKYYHRAACPNVWSSIWIYRKWVIFLSFNSRPSPPSKLLLSL